MPGERAAIAGECRGPKYLYIVSYRIAVSYVPEIAATADESVSYI